MTAERPRIATSIRFIIAMMRLYAGVESNFGKAVLDILHKQYPGQEITETAGSIGAKLMAIARKQLQGNDSDSMDAIQNFLSYISTGSTYETNDKGVIKRDEDGEPIMRTTGKPWDFAKDFPTWDGALKAMFNNLRTTAMSGSMGKSRRKKNERSVDDAFGTRDEDGGAKGNGEGRMPTPDDTALGKSLDDQAALREFHSVIDDYLPDLRKTLTPPELVLFDVIMDDEVGGFGTDIKENMGQATAVLEKMKEKVPEFVQKHEKRWSGAVGDLRKKVLEKIWDFVDDHMTPGDRASLRESFFSDADPAAIRKIEKDKSKGKDDYQRGIDERKVSRLKAEKEEKGSSFSKQDELDRLSKKLKGMGVDVDAIKPDANAGAKKKTKPKGGQEQQASIVAMAVSIASRPALRRSDLGL